MSTISDTTTAQLYAQRPQHSHGSEKGRFTSTINSEVSAGSLSSTDATALTSALGAIDSSLSSDRTASTSGSASSGTGSKLDPSSIKERIDGLISNQVSSGTLTSDQATELKSLFSSHGRSTQAADSSSSVSDAGGGPDGPPPGPPPGAAASGGTSSGSDSAGTSGGTSSSDLLATFIQQLQAAQSSSAGYGASGTSGSTNASALLFDFQS